MRPNQAPTDLSDLTTQLCERLGVEAKYVYRIDLTVDTATVYAYAGREGFCQGPKYVHRDDPDSPFYGEAALEAPLTLKVVL